MNNNNCIFLEWAYVPKNSLNENDYKYLTLDIPFENEKKTYNIWADNGEYISIPRFCDNITNRYKILDVTTPGIDIDINILVPPRDEQKEAISAMLMNTHGICRAKTGFGKTYTAINVISTLKKKAMILVHKRSLALQWKEDILKYTDLKDEDVSLPKVLDEKNLNAKIVITTVQSFLRKIQLERFDARQFIKDANFGITFFDECHITSGPFGFLQASRWVFSKRIYGLSATPIRGDAFDTVIKWAIGDLIFDDTSTTLPVHYVPIPYYVNVPGNIAWFLQRDWLKYTVKYCNWIKNNDSYIETCASVLIDLILNNREVLALASTKDILDKVYSRVLSLGIERNIQDINDQVILIHGTINEDIEKKKKIAEELELKKQKKKNKKNKIEEDGESEEAEESKPKRTRRDKSNDITCAYIKSNEKIKLILSTNKFFTDAISIDRLNTLVYLTPQSSNSMSNIPQTVGRIARKYKGKKFIPIFDIYNDMYDTEIKRYNKREEKYNSLGYTKTSYDKKSNQFESIKDVIDRLNSIYNW